MSTYRKYLGANKGHDAILWSNKFEVRYRKDGMMLLFLKDYEVKKIRENNLNTPKPKHSSHMWIKVPERLEKKLLELVESSRKISIKGKIQDYKYKNSNERNVSLNLYDLYQVKPKKAKLLYA